MLPGFELAVARMVPGEACDVCIPCTEAYGAYDGSLVVSVPRSALPASARLSEGERFRVRAGGEVASVKLVSREGDFLVIDCNHELAGEDLHFHIEYVGLASESAIERELHAGCSCGCRKLKEQLGA